jgi:uncharacterized MAPEG superfamily protein
LNYFDNLDMMMPSYIYQDDTMNTLLICLLIAMLLPYLGKIPLAYAMHKTGRYDNNYPREQEASLKGFGARALAAHENSFESLIVFSAAVLAALATNHVTVSIQSLAILHIMARIVYPFMYWYDLATLRSLVWLVGIACSVAIVLLCL